MISKHMTKVTNLKILWSFQLVTLRLNIWNKIVPLIDFLQSKKISNGKKKSMMKDNRLKTTYHIVPKQVFKLNKFYFLICNIYYTLEIEIYSFPSSRRTLLNWYENFYCRVRVICSKQVMLFEDRFCGFFRVEILAKYLTA